MSTPEAVARETIDVQLSAAGWTVQDLDQLDLSASQSVAIRELASKGGSAHSVLFVDGKVLGIVEARKADTTLSGASEQSERYSIACNGVFTTEDPEAYRDAWEGVDSCQGNPFAIAHKAFGERLKPMTEELNTVLVA